jgi:hypothetical protein
MLMQHFQWLHIMEAQQPSIHQLIILNAHKMTCTQSQLPKLIRQYDNEKQYMRKLWAAPKESPSRI